MDEISITRLTRDLATRRNLVAADATTPAHGAPDTGATQQGGLRTRGLAKRGTDEKPLLSVVTVVYNNVATLEETIRSVIFQSWDNVEYIVVDGGSDDGTLDIIRDYDDVIDYWVSGPDNGIYDAMNRGVELAGGRYINFLNADDHYLHNGVLERVVRLFMDSRSDIISGDAVMLDKQSGYGHIRHCNVNRYYYLFKGMPQQVFFYDTRLFDSGHFDDSYRIAADLDFYLSHLGDPNVKITHVHWPIVVFMTGGTSSNVESLATERDVIIRKHYSWLERLLFRNRFFRSQLVRNDLHDHRPGLIDRIIRKFAS